MSRDIDKLHCAPRPCESCPYRRDVPSGLWEAHEYEKLPEYDPQELEWPNGKRYTVPGMAAGVFHCHQENATGVPTVCRGWLHTHPDCIAVRLAVNSGALDMDDVEAEPAVPVFSSGAEAAAHGLAGIEAPDDRARALARKLVNKGAGR